MWFQFEWSYLLDRINGLFQICGFCPFYLKDPGKPNYVRLVDFLTNFWLLLQLISNLSLLVWAIYMYFTSDFQDQLDVSNDMLRVCSIHLAYISAVIESAFTKSYHRKYEECVKNSDDSSKEIFQDFDEALLRFQMKVVKKTVYLISLMILFEVLVIINIHEYFGWSFSWAISIFPLLMSRLRQLQYMLYVEFLGFRFKMMKKELKELAKITKIRDNKLIVKNENYSEKFYEKINKIKKIYNILWESSLLVNQSFGFTQLTNMLQKFVQLTCNFYWIYTILFTGKHLFHIVGK